MNKATTLTRKGEVAVPLEIRRRLGLKAGDKLACNMLSIGTVVFRPKTHTLADVAGMLARPDQAVPVERMSPSD